MENTFGNISLEVIKASKFVEEFMDNVSTCRSVNEKSIMFMDNQAIVKKNFNILNTYIATCDDTNDETYNIAKNTIIAFENCMKNYKNEMQVSKTGSNVAENMVIESKDVDVAKKEMEQKIEEQKGQGIIDLLPNFTCVMKDKASKDAPIMLSFHADSKEEVNEYLNKVMLKYGFNRNIHDMILYRMAYKETPLKEEVRTTVVMA